ncbi:MAG TPA: hypothetical protein VHY35_03570 [Stellaceae bacterium]|jgi:CheY-like chemotaxis protein|nr:hypothetical protein [Stellaceae bacterium]
MASTLPRILVVDSDTNRCARGVAALLDAGFAVAMAAVSDAIPAVRQQEFSAVVVALPCGDGDALVEQARQVRPALKMLLLRDDTAMAVSAAERPVETPVAAAQANEASAEQNPVTMVRRLCEPRELVGYVIDLILWEGHGTAALPHLDVAEQGIAAAKLACLYRRHGAAACDGARRLMQELSRQIEEMQGIRQSAKRPKAARVASVPRAVAAFATD